LFPAGRRSFRERRKDSENSNKSAEIASTASFSIQRPPRPTEWHTQAVYSAEIFPYLRAAGRTASIHPARRSGLFLKGMSLRVRRVLG
jgi:hypothetical protein